MTDSDDRDGSPPPAGTPGSEACSHAAAASARNARVIRLDIQYVGTRYAGWQVQPGQRTIQGTIEESIMRVVGDSVRVHGAGRTDAGVHARGQVAHFGTSSPIDPGALRGALGHFLPADIRVTDASLAPPGFHARKSARSKEYRYRIVRGQVMPPHLHPFAILARAPLDTAAMREGAGMLMGTHDFGMLRTTGSSAETTVRTVLNSEWIEEGQEIVYRISADGFLYRMVRSIAGLLLEIGKGRLPPEAAQSALGGEQSRAALSGRRWQVLPARGLHLWHVDYRERTGPENSCHRTLAIRCEQP